MKRLPPFHPKSPRQDTETVPVPPYAGYIADHIVAPAMDLSTSTLGYLAAHTDDLAVDAFAAAMKAKLALKRAQGYGGWNDPHECSVARLSAMLIDHVGKGDPVDVGNFAMMIHQRGGRIFL